MDIKAALSRLDPEQDDLWTSNGLPLVEAVSKLVGREVSRQEITNADPQFNRDGARLFFEKPEENVEPLQTVEGLGEAPTPVEEEDPTKFAFVLPADEVVGMIPQEVFADIDLLDRAIAEFSRQATVLGRRRDAILAKLKEVGKRSAQLSAIANRIRPRDHQRDVSKRYLEAQNRSRQERAKRAQKFAESGTSIDDVRSALDVRAPVDNAMRVNRKRGMQRPAYPQKQG